MEGQDVIDFANQILNLKNNKSTFTNEQLQQYIKSLELLVEETKRYRKQIQEEIQEENRELIGNQLKKLGDKQIKQKKNFFANLFKGDGSKRRSKKKSKKLSLRKVKKISIKKKKSNKLSLRKVKKISGKKKSQKGKKRY